MSRRYRCTLPLQLWLALALIAIVGAPALTTWALSVALAPRVAPGVMATVATVRRLMGDDPARWRDPTWQHQTRQRLARLRVDVVLDDMAGHRVFATSSASIMLWGIAPASRLRSEHVTAQPLPPRTVMTFALIRKLPAGHPRSATPAHMRIAARLVGVAVVALPITPTPRPPDWLVPLAGLAALLGALAVVAWSLGRLVLRPLAAMSRAADQIAGGNLEVRLPPSRAREVAEVATALAGMSAALQTSLRRQSALEEERKLFIGAIAHDLHTPLFVLRGYLQGLERGIATTPQKVAAYAAECRARVDALARLIADLFAYTKVEYLDQALQLGPLDLGALLRQALAGLQPLAAEKDLALTLDGPAAPCPIVGDWHLLTRAIENLVDNALRHTPAGGEISLSWGVEGQRFVIRVTDTGPGIAAQDLPHLFTPLYRGESSRNRQTGGAGLGLAIARRIMRAHGGNLTAANRATGGAVFTATLPIGEYALAPDATDDAVSASPL